MECEEEVTRENDQNNVSLEEEIDEYCKTMPLTQGTQCGFWILKGSLLQRMASKKMLVLVFGLCTSVYSASFAYTYPIMTTTEKVFKIPNTIAGIITTGNDIVQLFGSALVTFYASKSHRPRCIAFGLLCSAIACFLNAMPHFLYGVEDDLIHNSTNSYDNQSCGSADDINCGKTNNFAAANFFVAQIFRGIGGLAINIIGLAYLDDNIQRKKSPIVLSLMFFLASIGPMVSNSLATICLKIYIQPNISPNFKNDDPRWLGAWWLGWLILGILLVVFSLIMAMFPDSLPRSAARREILRNKTTKTAPKTPIISFRDLFDSLKRLTKNTTLLLNLACKILYTMGYTPFWVFIPKYMETMYRTSAADVSWYLGTWGWASFAIGTLTCGILVHVFKPTLKTMALCTALANLISAFALILFMFLGCPDVDKITSNIIDKPFNTTMNCNADLECNSVKFIDICSMDGTQSFISPCHAGCSQTQILDDNTILYKNCSCITSKDDSMFGSGTTGPCPTDCHNQFILFIAIFLVVKFIFGCTAITIFLISIRCVEDRDKPTSLGIDSIASTLSTIPAPILFGAIIDSACSVWNKNRSGTGNCWLTNSILLRNRIGLTSLIFLTFCSMLSFLNWFIMKDSKELSDISETQDEAHKDIKEMVELVKK